ncbi:hypothetical protein V1509DRAFT_621896 [Lipomyces kononenkoae]
MTSTLRYRDVENWSRQVVAPPPPLILRRTSTVPNSDSDEQHPRPPSAASTWTHRSSRTNYEQQPLETSESGFVPYNASRSMLHKGSSTSPMSSRRPSHDGYSFQHTLSQEDPYAPGSLAIAAAAITAIAASAAAAASLPADHDITARRKVRSLPIATESSYETDTQPPLISHDQSHRHRHHRHHHPHHHHHHHHRHHDPDPNVASNKNEVDLAEDDPILHDNRHKHNNYPDRHRYYQHSHREPVDHDNSPTPVSDDETGGTPSTPVSTTASPDSFSISTTTSPDVAFTPLPQTSPKLSSNLNRPSRPTRQKGGSLKAAPRQISRSNNTTRDSNPSRQENPNASSTSVVSSARPVKEKPESRRRRGSPQCCVIM